jgi:hypothetical protein
VTIPEIKKAYRARSVLLHPDKNPQGEEAFKRVGEAYECLIDSSCRTEYDRQLNDLETQLQESRAEKVEAVRDVLVGVLADSYRWLSLAARQYFLASRKVWEIAGDLSVSLPPSEQPIPVGRAALTLLLLLRMRILVVLYFLSVGVLRLNYHIISAYVH